MTQAAYVDAVLAAATARGATDSERLARTRADAIDFWQSRLDTFNGRPSGSIAPVSLLESLYPATSLFPGTSLFPRA